MTRKNPNHLNRWNFFLANLFSVRTIWILVQTLAWFVIVFLMAQKLHLDLSWELGSLLLVSLIVDRTLYVSRREAASDEALQEYHRDMRDGKSTIIAARLVERLEMAFNRFWF